jgi:hypothetical protein
MNPKHALVRLSQRFADIVPKPPAGAAPYTNGGSGIRGIMGISIGALLGGTGLAPVTSLTSFCSTAAAAMVSAAKM